MADQKTVLVLGATGRQGGATARHLLARGWSVRALTRDPNQPAARALSQAGAAVVQGDSADRGLLAAAIQGMYGIFSVQATHEGEVEQGKNVTDVAKAAGVQHFVYTSVQSAEDLARAGGDGRKWEIEQYIWGLGLSATILRPSFFMETLLAPRTDVPDGTSADTFSIGVNADVAMGLIAVDDIGAFAALAFVHPDVYLGKTIELAGDVRTPTEIAAALSHASGHVIPYVHIPIELIRQQDTEIANSIDFLNATGYTGDVAGLRKQYPGLINLETWLQREGNTTVVTRR